MTCVLPIFASKISHPVVDWDDPFKKSDKIEVSVYIKHKTSKEEVSYFAKNPPVLRSNEILLPCNRCVGCLMDRAREWAYRCMCEKRYHDKSSFITLTYAPEHLPEDGSLHKDHFQKFMKRLRSRTGLKLRFFQAGEYGSKLSRPHFHAIIFGFDFPDREIPEGVSFTSAKRPLYTSKLLSELWPFGFNTVADVSYKTCAYVARYIAKKKYGSDATSHYDGKIPEYITMSNRPGIGYQYFMDFKNDLISTDLMNTCVLHSEDPSSPKFKIPIPRYFLKLFERHYPEEYEVFKQNRKELLEDRDYEEYWRRISVQYDLFMLKFEKYSRRYEVSDET